MVDRAMNITGELYPYSASMQNVTLKYEMQLKEVSYVAKMEYLNAIQLL